MTRAGGFDGAVAIALHGGSLRGARGDGIGIADGGADDLHGASGLARGAGGAPTWRYRPPSASGGLREIARKRTEGSGRQLWSGVGSASRTARAWGDASDNASILSPVDIARGLARSARRDARARPSEGPTDVRFADTIGSPESGRKFPTGSVARAPLALAGTRTRIGNRGGRHRGRHGGRLHLRLGSLARDRGCRSLCNGPSRSRHAPDPQLRVDVGVSRGSTNQIARRPEIQIHEPESNARDSRIDELTRPEHP